MPLCRFETDLHVAGAISCDNITIPKESVDDSQVAANAGIAVSKLRHLQTAEFSEHSEVTVTDKVFSTRRMRAGNLMRVLLGVHTLMSAGGSDNKSVTITVKKNGTTVGLTGSATITKATAAKYVLPTVPTTPHSANDLYTVEIADGGDTGTQAEGVYVALEFDESGA
ncbi:MAG: hypothetical protein IPM64_17190 [Phycisphaerales bacterium]|nr:hypothetical protein [Phycisphaerales bacterium]